MRTRARNNNSPYANRRQPLYPPTPFPHASGGKGEPAVFKSLAPLAWERDLGRGVRKVTSNSTRLARVWSFWSLRFAKRLLNISPANKSGSRMLKVLSTENPGREKAVSHEMVKPSFIINNNFPHLFFFLP